MNNKKMKLHSGILGRQFSLLVLLLISLTSFQVVADTDNELEIQKPVIALHDALLQLMKNAGTNSFTDRYDSLAPVIKQNFDTALISKVVLSRYWQALDEIKQDEFIDLFNHLTISTYVSRFDSYSDEKFMLISIEQMKKNRYMVKTELLITNKDDVSFNYIVQNDPDNDGNWKIISVIANGINDLALKRAEYSAVIQDKGYDSLLTDIRQKISDLETK